MKRRLLASTAFVGVGIAVALVRGPALAAYTLGPGIVLDAELANSWVDTDPEGFTTADGVEIDKYDALELGMGVALTF